MIESCKKMAPVCSSNKTRSVGLEFDFPHISAFSNVQLILILETAAMVVLGCSHGFVGSWFTALELLIMICLTAFVWLLVKISIYIDFR